MKLALITGSGGLVGLESVYYFAKSFDAIIGIDNDSRGYFFGPGGSVAENIRKIRQEIPSYLHYPIDIRDRSRLSKIFTQYGPQIKLIIHTAAQPSHDWSGKNPLEDFEINALGTVNLLEEVRQKCPEAVFIHCSSSKVYGDHINKLGFVEFNDRFDLPIDHQYYNGFTEDLQLDQSLHSPYGASKASSDMMCQEYSRYYGLKVGIFRPNCITGGSHSGVELHGFLSYLVKCKSTYNIIGFEGKQVRDNIHALDLVRAFDAYFKRPRSGQVYNIGGGRKNSCSIIEAIKLVEHVINKELSYKIVDSPRIGDHKWWITNNSKFINDYPEWDVSVKLGEIIQDIHEN